LAVASEKLWQALCVALQHPEWQGDPRFAQNADRVRHRDLLCGLLAAQFANAPVQHWLDRFDAAGVPAARVNGVAAAIAQPITKDRDLLIEIDGVPLLGSPLKLSATPVQYLSPPPGLGAHSDAILAELGLDAAALRAVGAVR